MRTLSLTAKALLVLVVPIFCASCGPHMKNQVSIQPYEQRMPTMPSGAVPIEGRLQTLTAQQSALTTNPLPATPVNRKNGGIYYGYYCLMCHGVKGDGNGPVGQSYVPKPTDLSSPAVTSMNDGQIYGAMLNGVGHSPVLAQTVLPEHRWPLVMYVRTFSGR